MLLNETAGKGLAKLSNNFEVNVSEKNFTNTLLMLLFTFRDKPVVWHKNLWYWSMLTLK